MPESTGLHIEVVSIGVDPPLRIRTCVPAGTTVAEALATAPVAWRVAPALPGCGVAIYGRRVGPGEPLSDGDRIELLPPLVADPKAVRAQRAEHRRRAAGDGRWSGPGGRTPDGG